jgi:hypothetical protein
MRYRSIKLLKYIIIFVIFFLIACLTAYASSQNYGDFNFEFGEGSGWVKDCFGGHEWTIDLTQGNNSKGSMRSTDLGKGTETLGLSASSICRTVSGPAYITFWWKSETIPSGCGELYFFVNEVKKPFYSKSIWTQQLYYLPENKSYIIGWRYIQKNTKLYKGSGWIDDISIAPAFQDISANANLNCNIYAPDLASVGSTFNAYTPQIDGLDYRWEITGGEILGDPNNQSVRCRLESSRIASLKLNVSKPGCGSATCSKDITVTPKNWPYSNYSIPDLCNAVKLPPNNITYVDLKYDPLNYTYQNITDAINNVTCGGTVVIGKGRYNEEIVINKPIILIGLDKNNTTIIGKGHVIYIASDDVLIKNLTIQGGAYGIQVFGNDCRLIDINILNSSLYGIFLIESDYLNIEGCNLRNIGVDGQYGMGIYSYSSNYTNITDNLFTNASIGIQLWDVNHDFIDNNKFSLMPKGILLLNESGENNLTCRNKFENISSEKRIIVNSKLKNLVCNLNSVPS